MMIEHPVLLFIFALANIVSGLGWFTAAALFMPHAQQLSALTRAAGLLAAAASGVAHLGLAVMALFHNDMTAGQAAASGFVLSVHVAVAVGAWAFIAGFYLERGASPARHDTIEDSLPQNEQSGS
jgi:hypothetical protein